MANIKSAKKRVLQIKKRQEVNLARQSAMKTAVRKVLNAIQAGKTKEEVQKLFIEVQVKCARAKGKGTIHANAAARKVSRLAKKVNLAFSANAVKPASVPAKKAAKKSATK